MTKDILIQKAQEARKAAYVPYSKFGVGSALKTASGKIYTGCNIESASFTPSCCAERVAIFKAISNEERKFTDLAVTANTSNPIAPCGVCRQVMNEFFDDETNIHLTNLENKTKTVSINDLLPYSFNSF